MGRGGRNIYRNWRLGSTTSAMPGATIHPEAIERIKRLIDETKAATRTTSAAATRTATRAAGVDRTQLVERCRKYVAKMPAAVSGQGGHDGTFAVACVCFKFGLTDGEAAEVLSDFNGRCEPPWSEVELQHKLSSARDAVTRGANAAARAACATSWRSGSA